ncbi:MAG TPA: hypothetical protein VNX68_09515 [Nitrosopumilaceae archaeon]|jgi:hypothetical protein|nr:hypothetical protein [Nitrosopumilaceae archaeon]
MKKKNHPANIRLAKKREAMMEAGAYDGRYKEKVVKNKKKYSRKNKRKDD